MIVKTYCETDGSSAALLYRDMCGDQVPPETLAVWQQVFRAVDTEPRDGRLDTREVRELLARLGQAATEHQLREMVRGVDMDEDGSIDLSEFITMMTEKMRKVNLEGEVRKLFCTFDLDGDGNITCSELSKVPCRCLYLYV